MRQTGRKRSSISGQFDDPDEPVGPPPLSKRQIIREQPAEQYHQLPSSPSSMSEANQSQSENIQSSQANTVSVGPPALILVPYAHPRGRMYAPSQFISHGGTQWMVPVPIMPSACPPSMFPSHAHAIMMNAPPHPIRLQQHNRPVVSPNNHSITPSNSQTPHLKDKVDSTATNAHLESSSTMGPQLRSCRVPPTDIPRTVFYNTETNEIILDHNMPPIDDWIYRMDVKQRKDASGGYVPSDLVNKGFGLEEHEVRDTDVLCGRGGQANTHPGNIWYRAMVTKLRGRYAVTPKHRKYIIASYAIGTVRSRHGRFLKRAKDNNNVEMWYEVGDDIAMAKALQTLREGMAKVNRDILKKYQNRNGQTSNDGPLAKASGDKSS